MSARTINILHILGTADRGGTEIMTCDLITRMGPSFHNEICVLGGEGPIGEDLRDRGFLVYYLYLDHLWSIPSTVFRLYRLLQANDYEILHLYGLKANFLGRILGRLSGHRKILGGLRSQYPSGFKRFWTFWVDRVTFPLSLGYVANSQTAIEVLTSHGYDQRKFWLIYNGIDTRLFHNMNNMNDKKKLRQYYGIKPDLLVICCIANFLPPKGLEYLIRALHLLLEKGQKDFIALIIGEGPLRLKLERLVREFDLVENIRFLGSMERKEIFQILTITSIFVLSSEWEGLPTAVMEAMAAGCPIVATAVGGIPELVNDGETGFLVQACEPEALAQKIAQLLKDRGLRERMGRVGARRIEEIFSLEKMVKEYERLYEKIIES
ncbi:MAG: glycosyltransferase [Candidatus Hodarchaeota archaeon]